MVWQHDPDNHVTFDREAGLFLRKDGTQRDNFKYSILSKVDNVPYVAFQASPQYNPDAAIYDAGGILEYVIVWRVVVDGITPSQEQAIAGALAAYSNPQPGGFAKFKDGKGLRANVLVEYVDGLEGF